MIAIDPLVKQVTVPLTPDQAFTAFIDEMGEWWPLATHSCGTTDAVDVTVEPRLGGRIVESTKQGDTHIWGTITEWSPPAKVAFTWHPGTPPDEATRVELTFTAAADGAGSTDVVLTHSGWENRPDGEAMRSNYDPGWDMVLGRFTAKVG